MNKPFFLFLIFIAAGGLAQDNNQSRTDAYYEMHKGNSLRSISSGMTGKGKLLHGKLFPFSGSNFRYYSQWSYLQGRAFVHSDVRKTVLDAYKQLDRLYPGRQFGLMEGSLEKGGKIKFHNTHQNGLSVDFMSPKQKHNAPDYELDSLGIKHYFLVFNTSGQYENDTSIGIDFNLIAHHLLVLDACARHNHLKIKKVIWMIELKDELFASEKGKILKKSGMYFAKVLTDPVNKFHDDHYHVDFELLD